MIKEWLKKKIFAENIAQTRHQIVARTATVVGLIRQVSCSQCLGVAGGKSPQGALPDGVMLLMCLERKQKMIWLHYNKVKSFLGL